MYVPTAVQASGGMDDMRKCAISGNNCVREVELGSFDDRKGGEFKGLRLMVSKIFAMQDVLFFQWGSTI